MFKTKETKTASKGGDLIYGGTANETGGLRGALIYAASAAFTVLMLLFAAIDVFAGGQKAGSFDTNKAIDVVSREDGSGTRSAFIELFEIEERGADGSRKDMTTKEAVIAKQTDVMMTNIASGKYGIGYISLGSLNDSVKAVSIDGAAASADNVKNGVYKVSRPFFIASLNSKELSPPAKDFVNFIMSAEGQAVIAKSYIAVNNSAPSYIRGSQSGKVVVAGSSSVTPVMEKLREAYIALNPGVTLEIQMSDSSAGLSAAASGICDIAMSSRELKDTETAKLNPTQIAIDGIAVIVNKDNPVSALSKAQVKAIFTGKTAKWSGL